MDILVASLRKETRLCITLSPRCTQGLVLKAEPSVRGPVPRAATACSNQSAHAALLQACLRSRRERLHLHAPSGALLSDV